MIEDVDYLGHEWGKRMRSQPSGWYRENHIARLLEEDFIGSGNSFKLNAVISDRLDVNDQSSYQPGRRSDFRISASGATAATYGALGRNSSSGPRRNFKTYGPIIPIELMTKDQLRFHRAWRERSERDREFLWTHFVPKVHQYRKLDLLKITQAEYNRRLDVSLNAVAFEIIRIDDEDQSKNLALRAALLHEAAPKLTSEGAATPLWPCRIFSYVHKVAINDSWRDPFPVCLSLTGHNTPSDPFFNNVIDSNIYCKRPDGELFTVVPTKEWMRLRRQGRIDMYLAGHRDARTRSHDTTASTVAHPPPIRVLRQNRKGQWLVGEKGSPIHIRKLKGLEHLAVAVQSPEKDVLRAVWGLDNDARLPTYSSEESFDQKAMRGYQTYEGIEILGIQSPEIQQQIKQALAEFTRKISDAEGPGLTDLAKRHKKDMADFKRLTRGSCITKTRSRPADDGDIFRPMLNNLRQRRLSALGALRKNGLNDEADDLEACYKIENRSVIFFAHKSRFAWVFDRD